jgi:hypothetical protein
MAKNKSEFVKNLKLSKPQSMEYTVNLSNEKQKEKFIFRIEKMVRASMEYKDYIQFLKEHIGLNKCIFFQNVSQEKTEGRRKKVSLEIHHEPLTLFDIVKVVVEKFDQQGLPMNDLLIADEVMELHYANKVGLVPLSKTAHEMVHDSANLFVPLTMCYGNYSAFLEEYEEAGVDMDELYEKIERKMSMTNNITPETFDALTRQFTYIEVDEFEDIERMDIPEQKMYA